MVVTGFEWYSAVLSPSPCKHGNKTSAPQKIQIFLISWATISLSWRATSMEFMFMFWCGTVVEFSCGTAWYCLSYGFHTHRPETYMSSTVQRVVCELCRFHLDGLSHPMRASSWWFLVDEHPRVSRQLQLRLACCFPLSPHKLVPSISRQADFH